MKDWLATTIGHVIFAWRPLSDSELAHELVHVLQWQEHGPAFALRYLAASFRSWVNGTGWYRGNVYEVAAFAAEEV